MARKNEFAVGEFYHIYSRGNDRQLLFLDDRDYLRFLVLLYTCNTTGTIHLSDHPTNNLDALFQLGRHEPLVAIGAYCLMPNHVHLLVRETKERGTSEFMQKLFTAYSMYFNKKYKRTGSLFEHPFRARHINNDVYLNYLLAYIHLNPVKINDSEGWQGKRILHPEIAKQYLEHFRYSSYLSYVGRKRLEDVLLNKGVFPTEFTSAGDFEKYIDDWINFDGPMKE